MKYTGYNTASTVRTIGELIDEAYRNRGTVLVIDNGIGRRMLIRNPEKPEVVLGLNKYGHSVTSFSYTVTVDTKNMETQHKYVTVEKGVPFTIVGEIDFSDELTA